MLFVKHLSQVVIIVAAGFSSVAAADTELSFNRDIRPILSENCYFCHGPDDNAREADLRLDLEESAKESAIVPGDAAASDLVDRIRSDDPDLLMPPPHSERKLSAEQIELIGRWIDEGARYEGHWSFIPPSRPPIPELTTAAQSRNPIDPFILARLAASDLNPAPPADRETLIRRVTFDLLGLPPTLAEIDAFVSDDAPGAYERLIDRLLVREEFGERMAADWLDVARYSDTYGYQVDRDRFVWPWRDWVIRAFNDNMPYDQFITEQLAGDLIPGATRDQILATTFNRLHPQKVEGGSVPEEFRIEYVADRTQTVGTALMGLTLECCRCHSHKYDPITQQEYYQLSAFFDNIDEAGLYSYFTPSVPTPTLRLPTPAQENELKERTAAVFEAERALSELINGDDPNADAERDDQSTLFPAPIATLSFEDPPKPPTVAVDGVVGKAVRLTGDDAIQTKVGNFHRYDPFSVSLWIKTPNLKDRAVVFHRSRAWTDAASRGYQLLIEKGRLSWSLIHFWPGNAIRIRTVSAIPTDTWVHVVVTNDGSSRADGLRIHINGSAAETEVVRDSLSKQITGGGGDTIAIGERFRDRGFAGGSVDEFRVFDTELTALEVNRLFERDSADQWSATDETMLSDEQRSLLSDHLRRRHNADVRESRQRLRQAREKLSQTEDACQEIMVMRELDDRRSSFLLERGGYDNRGREVKPETPAALSPFGENEPRSRLGLARWLTRPDHPLTARVAVNRLWQLCFGAGLVRTPEDFGSQGEPPTHPLLLDYLAVDLVENGWNIKRALKQIMMSATYRQSSRHPDPKVASEDPENRLWARFPSYRLSAEMLRDNALAVGGRLVKKLGGPPVKPYEVESSFKPSKRDTGQGLYRRSLYTYWKRTGPAPAMMTLDAAKRDVCQVRRERTSSPLQAFVLLNGPQFVEAARGLAEQLERDHAADVSQSLTDAFRMLTSRRPSEDQLDVLQDLYDTQLAYFREDDQKLKSFLAVGDAKTDLSLDQPRVAAMTVVVGTLQSFDLSVMKR